jgi:hypothetical protein
MGLNVLTIQSILALFVWIFALWLGRSGHYQVFIAIAGVEFAIYVALGSYLIGRDSGVYYILFCAGVGFLVAYKQPQSRAFWAAILSIEYILIYCTMDAYAVRSGSQYRQNPRVRGADLSLV